jgi:hypothetical protein
MQDVKQNVWRDKKKFHNPVILFLIRFFSLPFWKSKRLASEFFSGCFGFFFHSFSFFTLLFGAILFFGGFFVWWGGGSFFYHT